MNQWCHQPKTQTNQYIFVDAIIFLKLFENILPPRFFYEYISVKWTLSLQMRFVEKLGSCSKKSIAKNPDGFKSYVNWKTSMDECVLPEIVVKILQPLFVLQQCSGYSVHFLTCHKFTNLKSNRFLKNFTNLKLITRIFTWRILRCGLSYYV